MYNSKQINNVIKILKENKTNYWTGLECKNFEKEFSKYHKNKYSIAVSNGSVALEIALKSLNLKKYDKVLVTPRSFIISASCVLNLGLTPVFADVNSNGNLCINSIKKNSKYKHQIIVHINEGKDGTIDYLKKKKIPYSWTYKNVGLCKGVNLAVQKSKKNILFIHMMIFIFVLIGT